MEEDGIFAGAVADLSFFSADANDEHFGHGFVSGGQFTAAPFEELNGTYDAVIIVEAAVGEVIGLIGAGRSIGIGVDPDVRGRRDDGEGGAEAGGGGAGEIEPRVQVGEFAAAC